MGFLAPFFLLGGLLVALPVILHLTRRRREPVAFPSFLLLPAASAAARWKRRRFRNLPLLLLRCLALLLLAAAFAQPLIETGAAETPEQAPLDLAVLVDRSLSMSLSSRMEEAQRAAGEELDRLGGRDRAVVVAFSDQAEALTELTREAPILRSAVFGHHRRARGNRIRFGARAGGKTAARHRRPASGSGADFGSAAKRFRGRPSPSEPAPGSGAAGAAHRRRAAGQRLGPRGSRGGGGPGPDRRDRRTRLRAVAVGSRADADRGAAARRAAGGAASGAPAGRADAHGPLRARGPPERAARRRSPPRDGRAVRR